MLKSGSSGLVSCEELLLLDVVESLLDVEFSLDEELLEELEVGVELEELLEDEVGVLVLLDELDKLLLLEELLLLLEVLLEELLKELELLLTSLELLDIVEDEIELEEVELSFEEELDVVDEATGDELVVEELPPLLLLHPATIETTANKTNKLRFFIQRFPFYFFISTLRSVILSNK